MKYLIQLDSSTAEEYRSLLKKYNIKSPTTGNDLTEPIEYNLMFSTQLGPSAATKGFVWTFHFKIIIHI